MESVVEQQRWLHEEIERLEDAVIKELVAPTRTVRLSLCVFSCKY